MMLAGFDCMTRKNLFYDDGPEEHRKQNQIAISNITHDLPLSSIDAMQLRINELPGSILFLRCCNIIKPQGLSALLDIRCLRYNSKAAIGKNQLQFRPSSIIFINQPGCSRNPAGFLMQYPYQECNQVQ